MRAKVVSTVISVFLIVTIAEADSTPRMRQSCDAVQRLAEIDFDSALLVNLARDNHNHTCVFYVSLPPSTGATEAIRRSAAEVQMTIKAGDAEKAGLNSASVTAGLIESLLLPLKEERFQSNQWRSLDKAVRERVSLIQDCATKILPARLPFKLLDSVIACGVTNADSKDLPRDRIVLYAGLGAVSVALILPMS